MKFLYVVALLMPFACYAQKTTYQPPANHGSGFPQAVFHESPITSCRPKGWLLEFLERQRSGLTGHPEVLSYPFNSCLWAGVIQRAGEYGANWWRYEQTAYYSDGLLRLGYLLGDSTLIRKGMEGVHYTLSHPQKNGRLGPGFFDSQWPIAVYFRVLLAAYSATRNAAIIDALHKHYLSYTPEEIGLAKRNIVNIEGMLWTYGKTHDVRLLKLAERAYALGGFELNLTNCLTPEKVVLHGVTYMEMAKLPAILYIYSGKKIYLQAAINAMEKLDRDHMLPDGVPSSNEFLAGKDPLQSHETCDISDYTWSLGYMLMATGDATWADRLEKAVFNAGPGAVSKDFKNLQYFSSVNQVIATGTSNQNKFMHGSTWMAYWPCHETECCAGNVHRFMPNYVARMWMRDRTGAPLAALYGPSTEEIILKTGARFIINEATRYPFSDRIMFTFQMNRPIKTQFTFRIPAWCHAPRVTINKIPYPYKLKPGSMVTLHRVFHPSDTIVVQLPMTAHMKKWEDQGLMVERGPLVFAYPVPEIVKTDTATYANLRGKRSHNPDFPALDIRPGGPWNYALVADTTDENGKIRIEYTDTAGYPFDLATVPLKIQVPARQVLNWKLQENRYTPPLPRPGQYKEKDTVTYISLVPYGATRLRMTVFPRADP